jgi:hypothetical protein
MSPVYSVTYVAGQDRDPTSPLRGEVKKDRRAIQLWSRHERRGRQLKNVSRNRPDATNLNHQNANRRVFMGLSCNAVCCAADSPKRGKRV